jgi:GT2 family glycosyltransferase
MLINKLQADAADGPFATDATRVKWSTVVINFNGEAHILQTLESLRATLFPPDEIIVVDDGSTDRSLDLVRETCPDVRIVPLGRNTGRTSIVRNAGLKAARHRFVLVTDNDILFAPDAVQKMLEIMLCNPDAAACTPAVHYDDRRDELFLRGHQLHYLCWSCRLSTSAIGSPEPAIGCGIQLLDRDRVLELGGFDENLLIGWGDDGELHHRLRMIGTPCYSVPAARVFHARVRLSQRRFAQVHNRLYMLAKCYSLRSLLILAPALIGFEAFLAIYMTVTGSGGDYLRAVREVWSKRARLMAERRAIQARRKLPDKEILSGTSLSLPLERYGATGILGALTAAFREYWHVAQTLL